MTDAREKAIEQMRKVKALADHGVDGERDAAANRLARLMERHGVTMSELEGVEIERLELPAANGKHEISILVQVARSVVPDLEIFTYKDKRKKKVLCKCTKAQHAEICRQYEHYIDDFRIELAASSEAFVIAFIHANHIFPAVASGDSPELTAEELAKHRRAGRMMDDIQERQYRKKLGGNETAQRKISSR